MLSRLCVIVPAYNEEENIASVITDIRKHQPQADIVVVNDGSSDRTEAVAHGAGATVLNLAVNLGIGGAVQTGFLHARDARYDFAVQLDGDGQHQASDISYLLEPLQAGDADVVIGSRFVRGDGFQSSPTRRFGIRLISWVNRVLTGQLILDNTSGFRAYGRKAIIFLAENYPQDYPEPEAVVQLLRNGFRLSEVAVQMRARSGGSSSIKARHSVYYMAKVILSNIIGISGSRGAVHDR